MCYVQPPLVQTDCTTAVPAGLDSGTLFSLGSQSGRAINPVAKKTVAMWCVVCTRSVSFSSCQRNLIKTFQIDGMIALITKMDLIFS